jgi:hypothetical protein
MDTNYYQAAPVVRDDNQKRFEAKWFKEEGFADIVQEKWHETATGQPIDVLGRLKVMMGFTRGIALF